MSAAAPEEGNARVIIEENLRLEVHESLKDVQFACGSSQLEFADEFEQNQWTSEHPCQAIFTLHLRPNPEERLQEDQENEDSRLVMAGALLPMGYALLTRTDGGSFGFGKADPAQKNSVMLSPSQTPDIHETLHTALMTIPLYRSLFADELNRKLEKVAESQHVSDADEDDVLEIPLQEAGKLL